MSPKAQNTAPQKDLNTAPATPTISREESSSPMTPKNFRNHPDMENFFRFIYENDLREEALHIIDGIILERQARRSRKSGGNA